MCSKKSSIKHLFNKWREETYGGVTQEKVLEHLRGMRAEEEKKPASDRTTIEIMEGNRVVVAIVTPVMRRIASEV